MPNRAEASEDGESADKLTDYIEECQLSLRKEYRRWEENDCGKATICIPLTLDLVEQKVIQTTNKNAPDYRKTFIEGEKKDTIQDQKNEASILQAFQGANVGGILINGVETSELSKKVDASKYQQKKINEICEGRDKRIKNGKNTPVKIDFLFFHPQLGMVVINVKSTNSSFVGENFARVFCEAYKQVEQIKERLPLLFEALTYKTCDIPVNVLYCFPQLEVDIYKTDVKRLTCDEALVKKYPNLRELHWNFPENVLCNSERRNFDAFWSQMIKNRQKNQKVSSKSERRNYFEESGEFRKFIAVLAVYRNNYSKVATIVGTDKMINRQDAANREKFLDKYPDMKSEQTASELEEIERKSELEARISSAQLKQESSKNVKKPSKSAAKKKISDSTNVTPWALENSPKLPKINQNEEHIEKTAITDNPGTVDKYPYASSQILTISSKKHPLRVETPEIKPTIKRKQPKQDISSISTNANLNSKTEPASSHSSQNTNQVTLITSNNKRTTQTAPTHRKKEDSINQSSQGQEKLIRLNFWNNERNVEISPNTQQEIVLNAVNDKKRVVLLGPPGSGKTLLLLHFAQEASEQNRPGNVIIFLPTEALANLYVRTLKYNPNQKRKIVINPTITMVCNVSSQASDDDVFVDEDFGCDWLPIKGRGEEKTRTVIAITAGRYYTAERARRTEKRLKEIFKEHFEVHRLVSIWRNSNQIYEYFFKFLSTPEPDPLLVEILRDCKNKNRQRTDEEPLPTHEDIVQGHDVESHPVDTTISADDIAECSQKISDCIYKLLTSPNKSV